MILRCWMAVLGLLACHAAAGAESLFGKVMCGYQGWFVTPADGEGMGWRHYGFDKQGQCHIDLWPDVSELEADERVDTPLKFADGSTAQSRATGACRKERSSVSCVSRLTGSPRVSAMSSRAGCQGQSCTSC